MKHDVISTIQRQKSRANTPVFNNMPKQFWETFQVSISKAALNGGNIEWRSASLKMDNILKIFKTTYVDVMSLIILQSCK